MRFSIRTKFDGNQKPNRIHFVEILVRFFIQKCQFLLEQKSQFHFCHFMSCLIKNHSRVGKKIRVRQVLETLFALLPKQGQVWVKIIKWALIFWRFWKTPTSFDSFFAKWWNFKVTRLLLITVFQIYLLNAIKRCICIKNSSKHNWFPKIGSNFEPTYFLNLFLIMKTWISIERKKIKVKGQVCCLRFMIYSKALERTEELQNVFGIVVTCFGRDFESGYTDRFLIRTRLYF